MENTWQNEENLTNNFLLKFSEKYNINYDSEDEELRVDIVIKLYKELKNFIGKEPLNRLRLCYYGYTEIRKYDLKTHPLIKKSGDFKKLLKQQVFNEVINFIYSCDAVNQQQRENNYNQLKNKLLTN
jgi:hypothetical protein